MAGHSWVVLDENLPSGKYLFCPQAVFKMVPQPLNMKLKIGKNPQRWRVFFTCKTFLPPWVSALARLIGQHAGGKLKFSLCEQISSKSVHWCPHGQTSSEGRTEVKHSLPCDCLSENMTFKAPIDQQIQSFKSQTNIAALSTFLMSFCCFIWSQTGCHAVTTVPCHSSSCGQHSIASHLPPESWGLITVIMRHSPWHWHGKEFCKADSPLWSDNARVCAHWLLAPECVCCILFSVFPMSAIAQISVYSDCVMIKWIFVYFVGNLQFSPISRRYLILPVKFSLLETKNPRVNLAQGCWHSFND